MNPIPVPIPLPKPNEESEKGLVISIAVAIAVLFLLLLLAVLLLLRGAGDDWLRDGGRADNPAQNATIDEGKSGGSSADMGNGGGDNDGQDQAGHEAGQEEMAGTAQPAEEQAAGFAGMSTPSAEDSGMPTSEEGNLAVTTDGDTTEPDKSSEEAYTSATDPDVTRDEQVQTRASNSRLTGTGLSTAAPKTRQGAGFLGKGDTEVSFFGTKGTGSRFVYVIDHSGSMAGAQLDMAKREVLNGLLFLKKNHQFNVYFYDHRFMSWDTKLIAATEEKKKAATQFIKKISPAGGTAPEPALKEAVALKPQYVFFLTDGEFSMNWDAMCAFANSNKVRINVIQFGESRTRPNDMLEQLAKRTQGDYQFIDVSQWNAL